MVEGGRIREVGVEVVREKVGREAGVKLRDRVEEEDRGRVGESGWGDFGCNPHSGAQAEGPAH